MTVDIPGDARAAGDAAHPGRALRDGRTTG